jgi:hypothetical protein
MCLAPSICSLDVDFFDEGTTANDFAKSKTNIYCRCRLEFAFGTGPARYHEIGLLMLIETS